MAIINNIRETLCFNISLVERHRLLSWKIHWFQTTVCWDGL